MTSFPEMSPLLNGRHPRAPTRPKRPGRLRSSTAPAIVGSAFVRGAVVVALALLLPSCGSEDRAPTAPSPGGTTPTPPDPPPPPPEPEPPPAPVPPPPGPLPTLGTPCPGVTVGAGEPEPVEGWLRVRLEFGWADDAGADGFDWTTPYFHLQPDYYTPAQVPPALEVNILSWNTETPTPNTTRHTLDLRWPPFLELGLSFRSEAGTCDLPNLFCAESGCGLRP